MNVAKRMVLFLHRSGNQAQFSSALRRQGKAPSQLRDLSTFVLYHIDSADQLRTAAGRSYRWAFSTTTDLGFRCARAAPTP